MASSKVMYSPCTLFICGFLASVAVLATAKPLDYGALFSSAAGKSLSPRMSLAAALSSRPQLRHSIIKSSNSNNNNQLAGSEGPALGSTYTDRMEELYRDLLYGPYAREESQPVVDLGDKQYAAAAEVPSMEQLQDLKQLLADYDAVYGNGGSTDNDYFQSEQAVAGNGADVGALYGDEAPAAGNYLTEAREGTWLDGPVSVPRVEYSTEDPLDDLLLNYFLQHYRDLTKGGAEEGGESETASGADLESSVEKRRQKVVINDEQLAVSSSTASPPHTTAAPSTSITARKPKLGPLAKAKTAAATKTNRRGQKEVALLRPAEAKPKQQQQEWPSELDENNLEEEEQSLKELSESMRAQSRPVRDVLTSQLDSLKMENQVKSGEQKQNN